MKYLRDGGGLLRRWGSVAVICCFRGKTQASIDNVTDKIINRLILLVQDITW